MGIGIFANVNQLLNEEIVFAAGEALGIEIRKMEDEADLRLARKAKREAEKMGTVPLENVKKHLGLE